MVGISARRKRRSNVDANLARDSDGDAGGKLPRAEFGRSKTFRGARRPWRKPGARENGTVWRDSAAVPIIRDGITVTTLSSDGNAPHDLNAGSRSSYSGLLKWTSARLSFR